MWTGSEFVRLLLENANLDVCVAIVYYNVENYEKLAQELGHGARLSVIIPTIRRGNDGDFELFIVDPSTKFVLNARAGANRTACRFCGKQNAKLVCLKCG